MKLLRIFARNPKQYGYHPPNEALVCSKCGGKTEIVDTTAAKILNAWLGKHRRRQCVDCGNRDRTIEMSVAHLETIIKAARKLP